MSTDDQGGGGKKIDLFPTNVLQHIADTPTQQAPPDDSHQHVKVPGFRGSTDVDLGSPFEFTPPKHEDVEDQRHQWLGPTYGALASPPMLTEAGFDDHVKAEAALSLLPAMLIGAVAKPAVAFLYKLLDKLPEAIRRPFEHNFGTLLDQGLALASSAVTPLIGLSVDKFYPDGSGLPQSAQIALQAHSQTEISCAETAAATILKYSGEPIPLSGVDTQAQWAGGASGVVDEELVRRGLSLISGPGDLTKLKAFLANRYPVMLSVGWESGGGHMVVVTGYDDKTGTVTINNWRASGDVSHVKYKDFLADWGRHENYMTVVVPQRDTRLTELQEQASNLRRPDKLYEGLTLSDFYVTQDGKVFVEGAYRYVTGDTDITVRLNFNQYETSLDRQLGGSVAIRRALGSGWFVGLELDKVSLRDREDNWSSFSTAPLAAYATLQGHGFEVKAGGQDGGFQASMTADLSRLLTGLGLKVNYSRDQDGTFRLFASLTGNF